MAASQNAVFKNFSGKTILLSGLLVGTLDICSAFVDVYIAGKNPLAVLPYIASGLFGQSVLNGGTGIMLTGLLLHYIIAFSFTIFFFWLCANTKLANMNWIVRGIVYGMFTWIIMNLIVVQLSGAPHSTIGNMKPARVLKAMLILICMIGLPLSFIVHKCLAPEKKTVGLS